MAENWITRIEEDGVTLKLSPKILFSMPPSYEYTILETKETFYSKTTDPHIAYRKWKEHKEWEKSNKDCQFGNGSFSSGQIRDTYYPSLPKHLLEHTVGIL